VNGNLRISLQGYICLVKLHSIEENFFIYEVRGKRSKKEISGDFRSIEKDKSIFQKKIPKMC